MPCTTPDFLADLKALLAKHGYTMAPEPKRINVHDWEDRVVCSFHDVDQNGPRELKFGNE
jgi:hypothetical protein